MATTPKKESEINCCICLSQNTRTFKLNGRKLSSENFERELSLLLQDDCLVSKLKCADAGVCRNCHNKVKGTFDFIQQVRYSCMSFLNEPFHVKRTMPSPLTPKSMQGCKTVNPTTVSTDTVHVVQPKSRKRLKVTFENSAVKCQNTTPSHDITVHSVPTVSFEHGYAAVNPDIKMESVDHAFQVVKSTWEGLTSDKENEVPSVLGNSSANFFHELRNQSRSLMSRTTMLASVLFKYREANSLVENADLLFQDIISEMKNR